MSNWSEFWEIVTKPKVLFLFIGGAGMLVLATLLSIKVNPADFTGGMMTMMLYLPTILNGVAVVMFSYGASAYQAEIDSGRLSELSVKAVISRKIGDIIRRALVKNVRKTDMVEDLLQLQNDMLYEGRDKEVLKLKNAEENGRATFEGSEGTERDENVFDFVGKRIRKNKKKVEQREDQRRQRIS